MNTQNQATIEGPHQQIQNVLDRFLRFRVNKPGRRKQPTSFRTQELRATCIHHAFRDLSEEGFSIRNIHNLSTRHLHALTQRWDRQKQKNSTISNKLSHLRIFCGWIGKPGLVRKMSDYFIGRNDRLNVSIIATRDKRLDLGTETRLFEIASSADVRFGLMLKMARSFGLRRKEILMFKPYVQIDWQNQQISIPLGSGSKGGRPRVIGFSCGDSLAHKHLRAFQEETLREVEAACIAGGALGWFDRQKDGLDRSISRYENLCSKIGLTKSRLGETGHSLRAAYAIDCLIREGFVPPIAGGNGTESRDVRDRAKRISSDHLGHSNDHAGPAYYGRLPRLSQKDLEVVDIRDRESHNNLVDQLGLETIGNFVSPDLGL
jgi:site-specific recombinase XerC